LRTHVVLPEELLKRLDQLVGKGRRSEFIERAVEDRLRKLALREAVRDIIDNEAWLDVPEWDDPDRWVRESRRDRDLESFNSDDRVE